jgi:hypothetical protein
MRIAKAVLLDMFTAAQWCRRAADNLEAPIDASGCVSDMEATQAENRKTSDALMRAPGSPYLDKAIVDGVSVSDWCAKAATALNGRNEILDNEIWERQENARAGFISLLADDRPSLLR